MNWKKSDKACGTWLQGEVDATYEELFETFGEEHSNGDEFKVSCQWCIEFDCGTVATIYDWKRNPKYWDGGEHFTNVEDWHIGGTTQRAVELVEEALTNN